MGSETDSDWERRGRILLEEMAMSTTEEEGEIFDSDAEKEPPIEVLPPKRPRESKSNSPPPRKLKKRVSPSPPKRNSFDLNDSEESFSSESGKSPARKDTGYEDFEGAAKPLFLSIVEKIKTGDTGKEYEGTYLKGFYFNRRSLSLEDVAKKLKRKAITTRFGVEKEIKKIIEYTQRAHSPDSKIYLKTKYFEVYFKLNWDMVVYRRREQEKKDLEEELERLHQELMAFKSSN